MGLFASKSPPQALSCGTNSLQSCNFPCKVRNQFAISKSSLFCFFHMVYWLKLLLFGSIHRTLPRAVNCSHDPFSVITELDDTNVNSSRVRPVITTKPLKRVVINALNVLQVSSSIGRSSSDCSVSTASSRHALNIAPCDIRSECTIESYTMVSTMGKRVKMKRWSYVERKFIAYITWL